MNKYKKIGILGGMGPEATADLYMKIVKYFQRAYGARYDKDFPEFLINSVPIPDVVKSIENEKKILSILSNATRLLQKSGCDFIVIACNSVQYLLPQLRKTVRIPIIGIAKVCSARLEEKGYGRVGILSTETTIKKKIYDASLFNCGICLIKPDKTDQKIITEIIMAQLKGEVPIKLKKRFLRVIENLRIRGAQTVLLACTELPLLIQEVESPVPLLDCSAVYAEEAAKFASNF